MDVLVFALDDDEHLSWGLWMQDCQEAASSRKQELTIPQLPAACAPPLLNVGLARVCVPALVSDNDPFWQGLSARLPSYAIQVLSLGYQDSLAESIRVCYPCA